MQFSDHAYHPQDTIAALATPPGEGGIAVIRVSGPKAIPIASMVFSKSLAACISHTAHFGTICDATGKKVDEALVLVFKEGRSFTGEDTVEIQCHGGVIISRKVLEAILAAGARHASPGEFTFRSYINGKMDLTQAESVQKLISARCERALEIALQQLEGKLSEKIEAINTQLLHLTATLEAYIDFPEEGIDFSLLSEIKAALDSVKTHIHTLLLSFSAGNKIEQGINLLILGAPNVGKSSLMNALLEKERAIVTPIPGTTRDLIEDSFTLNGLYFRLTDTAGIRETEEPIEKEGISRALQAWKKADITLLVCDASKGIGAEEKLLLKDVELEKTLLVWNKMDLVESSLPPSFVTPQTVAISAKERRGLEELKQKLEAIALHTPCSSSDIVLTSYRHFELFQIAFDACTRALQGLECTLYPELITFELRQALEALAKILGKEVTDDILTTIFAKFCIGK